MAVSKANRSKTICPVCSLQDGLVLCWSRSSARFTDDSLFAVDYDGQNPINEGSLCPRGNSVAELVDHPQRLGVPRLDGQDVDWKKALSKVASSLNAIIKKDGPEAMGVLAGGCLTLQEAMGVSKLAREVLKTPHAAPFFPDDGGTFRKLAQMGWDGGFSLKDLQARQVMLLVGDVFAEHPVISKRILRAKYKNRNHRLFVIDAAATQTSWFAHQHLQPLPGSEALVLSGIAQLLAAGEKASGSFPFKLDLAAIEKRTGVSRTQMESVAEALSTASDGAIIQSNLFGRQGAADVCALLGHALARLSSGKFVFLHLPVYWNGRGVYQLLAPADKPQGTVTGPRILELVMEGKIKGLLLFGLDLLSAVPSEKLEKALGKLKHLCVVDALPTHTTPLAHAVLPAAMGPEKGGQLLYLNGELQSFETALPAPGLARPEMEIITDLAKQISPKYNLSVTDQQIEEQLRTGKNGSWDQLLDEASLTDLLSADQSGEKAYPLHLVPVAMPAHLGDGALSRHFTWAARISAEPCIWASPALMDELRVKEGSQVQISSKADRVVLPVMLDRNLPENVIAAPPHFPEVRRLFSWKIDVATGELAIGPERVLISQAKEQS